MRYYLKHQRYGCNILCGDGIAPDGEALCPFIGYNPNATFPARCGSWCPLFQVIDALDGKKKVQVIHLHCGAGTRRIDIETPSAKEE